MAQKTFLSTHQTTYPFFYVIRSKHKELYYAGYCCAAKHCNSTTFMTANGYQTSSKRVKSVIAKYGVEDFEVLRIRHFATRQQACSYEYRFLCKVKANRNPKFYNQSCGGEKAYLEFQTEENKRKISETLKGRHITEKHKKIIGDLRRGVPLKQETRKKISNTKTGRTYEDVHGVEKSNAIKLKKREARLGFQQTEETKQKISQALKSHKRTSEHKANLAESLKGHTKSENFCKKRSVYMRGIKWWNNGVKESCSHNSPGEGWVRGRINTSQGRAWWNNGSKQKMSIKDLGEGWVKGKLHTHFIES